MVDPVPALSHVELVTGRSDPSSLRFILSCLILTPTTCPANSFEFLIDAQLAFLLRAIPALPCPPPTLHSPPWFEGQYRPYPVPLTLYEPPPGHALTQRIESEPSRSELSPPYLRPRTHEHCGGGLDAESCVHRCTAATTAETTSASTPVLGGPLTGHHEPRRKAVA